MSLLKRILGLSGGDAAPAAVASQSLTEIESQLGQLESEQARYTAAFAFVLARVAHADLSIDDVEVAEIRTRVAALAGLQAEQAELVAEIARTQARQLGGTDNYTVTREFRSRSSREQRVQLLECLHAVAAADGSISSAEGAEIRSIGEELGFTRNEINAVRTGWREQLAVLQGLPTSSD